MKTFKYLALCLAFITVSGLSSCKKDDKQSDKIVGKWTLEKIVTTSFIDGEKETETENSEGENFFQFYEDGKFSASEEGDDDVYNSTWELINDTKLTIKPTSDDSFFTELEIKTLTENNLVLYTKEVEGSDYYEATFYFKK